MPIPKDRSDLANVEPLKGFDFGNTELFLDLIHVHDEHGSKERL